MTSKRLGAWWLAATMGAAALGGCDGCDDSDTTPPPPAHHKVAGHGGGGAGGQAGAGGADACGEAALAAYASMDGEGMPPASPTDAVAPTGGENLQAMHHLWIGDTDRTGTASADAWRAYGFNVTGYDVDDTFPCGCTAPKPGLTHEDGDDHRKNSFGKNVVPMLAMAAGSSTINQAIAGGGYSFVLRIAALGADADQAPLDAQLYNVQGGLDADGSIAVTDAAWADGSYVWHPLPETLEKMGDPVVAFTSAYGAGHTFVSGASGDIPITFSLLGTAITIVVGHATLTVDLAADGSAGTNGNIGGVIRVADAERALKAVAGQLGALTCSLIQPILDSLEQAADVMADGSLGTGQTCDAISVGVGFDTNRVTMLGPAAPASTAGGSPCP